MVPSEAFLPSVSEIAVGGLSGPTSLAVAEIEARAGVPLADWQVRLAMALSCH
jgi:hypothetical protein